MKKNLFLFIILILFLASGCKAPVIECPGHPCSGYTGGTSTGSSSAGSATANPNVQKVYYVDPTTGFNRPTYGNTIDKPYQSVQYALDEIYRVNDSVSCFEIILKGTDTVFNQKEGEKDLAMVVIKPSKYLNLKIKAYDEGPDSLANFDASGLEKRVMHVGRNADVTIENIVITGGEGGVVVDGTLTMDGGKITGNSIVLESNNVTYGAYSGVGVAIKNGGSFTLENGEISHNNAYVPTKALGGGVYIYAGGRFCMNGGIIHSNTLSLKSAGSTYGGGLYAERNATLLIEGGIISGNTSSYRKNQTGYYTEKTGGGLYLEDGDYSFSNCTIKQNYTKNTRNSGSSTGTVDSSEGSNIIQVKGSCTLTASTLGDTFYETHTIQ